MIKLSYVICSKDCKVVGKVVFDDLWYELRVNARSIEVFVTKGKQKVRWEHEFNLKSACNVKQRKCNVKCESYTIRSQYSVKCNTSYLPI